MNLNLYVETIQRQVALAAEAGGDEARALGERLMGPLDAAIRLALLDVLSAAAEEITCDLAPGSVELRLRGRDPEFVVSVPAVEIAPGEQTFGDEGASPDDRSVAPVASGEGDDRTMSRINVRMPDHLKTRLEDAAAGDGLSVNAWIVRAAAAALERADTERRADRRAPQGAQRYTGWAR